MLPIHRILLRERVNHLHPDYEIPVDPNSQFDAQYERNKRYKLLAAAPAAPIVYPNQRKPIYTPGNVSSGSGVNDRLHKEGGSYVTVANVHGPNDPDPIVDPAWKHTITDGYAYARDVLAPALSSGQRVTVLVLGGNYTEDITFDNSSTDVFIDVVGVGRPTIFGKVTIATACVGMLFKNFRIVNYTPFTP